MLYSVWNQAASAYDYFRTDEPSDRVNSPPPRHLRPSDHGTPAHQAGHPLPVGARRVGSGPRLRGKAAVRRGDMPAALDGVADFRTLSKVGGAALLGYLAGRVLK